MAKVTVEAEIIGRYESGRVLVRWHSGEEIMSTEDVRLEEE